RERSALDSRLRGKDGGAKNKKASRKLMNGSRLAVGGIYRKPALPTSTFCDLPFVFDRTRSVLLANVPPPASGRKRRSLHRVGHLPQSRRLANHVVVANDRNQIRADTSGDLHDDVATAVHAVID